MMLSATLLRCSNQLQQKSIWYEFALGTYPSELDLWLPQHVRYPLVAVETVPNQEPLDCASIPSLQQDVQFLASVILHDIQWDSQGRIKYFTSFHP